MQISKLFLIVCVAALCLAPLPMVAAENEAQTPPPASKPQETTASKTELKKQEEANAKARKEADKKAKADAEAQQKAEKAEKKKQAEAEAKARKETEKQAQAEAAEKRKAEKDEKAILERHTEAQAKSKAKKPAPEPAKPKEKVERGQQVMKPIEAPPVPLSADKQQRLAELLQQYQKDQLSPEQYHQQRAKVLAEP